jgi:hypothetical protein
MDHRGGGGNNNKNITDLLAVGRKKVPSPVNLHSFFFVFWGDFDRALHLRVTLCATVAVPEEEGEAGSRQEGQRRRRRKGRGGGIQGGRGVYARAQIACWAEAPCRVGQRRRRWEHSI